MDHFTETTRTSFGKNLSNSFMGIIFGIALFVGSVVLLFWNESRSVEQASALSEMQKSIETRKAKLFVGEVTPLDKLKDEQFSIISDALAMKRTTLMYQWRENKQSQTNSETGGSSVTTTTYDYDKVWSENRIQSSSFKHREYHHNPEKLIPSHEYRTTARMGKYTLSKTVVSYFKNFQPLSLATFPKEIDGAKNSGEELYIGEDSSHPVVGDMRIIYSVIPSGVYTIAATVSGNEITEYMTQQGSQLLFVRQGHVSAETIFKEEISANNTLTWILRGVGLLLMFVSFMLITGPLGALANVLPILGSLVNAGTSLISLVLSLIIGGAVIILAWFSARPIVLIAVVATAIIGLIYLRKKSKKISKRENFHQEKDSENSPTVTPPQRSTPPPRK